jgi:hypothetical protein
VNLQGIRGWGLLNPGVTPSSPQVQAHPHLSLCGGNCLVCSGTWVLALPPASLW